MAVLAMPARLATHETSVTPEQKEGLSANSRDRRATTIPSDAPGAGTGSGQGTMTPSIDDLNPAEPRAGYYVDGSGANIAFLHAPDGAITPLDMSKLVRNE